MSSITIFYITLIFKALTSALQMDTDIFFEQLRILDILQQWLTYIFVTTVNALSEENRPQHRDHYPVLFKKCVGSFKSPYRMLIDWPWTLYY